MKVTYSKPKGQRILKAVKFKGEDSYGHTVRVRRPFWIAPIKPNDTLMFDIQTRNWKPYDAIKGESTSAYYAMSGDGLHDVYSLKAAKGLIHSWNMPKGTKFRVDTMFVGHSFLITV